MQVHVGQHVTQHGAPFRLPEINYEICLIALVDVNVSFMIFNYYFYDCSRAALQLHYFMLFAARLLTSKPSRRVLSRILQIA